MAYDRRHGIRSVKENSMPFSISQAIILSLLPVTLAVNFENLKNSSLIILYDGNSINLPQKLKEAALHYISEVEELPNDWHSIIRYIDLSSLNSQQGLIQGYFNVFFITPYCIYVA